MILDEYYARRNRPYIHAKGRSATMQLIRLLDIGPSDDILEVGCGTGSTLVSVLSRCQLNSLSAVDSSEVMVQKTNQRMFTCGFRNRADVQKYDGLCLPYNSESFNKIYAESVFAIQPGEHLPLLLSEVFRVLKVGGKLVFNETIWLPHFSKSEISQFNSNCKNTWGIIQSNEHYPYLDDWMQLLEKIGFTKILVHAIFEQEARRNTRECLSRIYSLVGEIKSKFSSSGRTHKANIENIAADFAHKGQIMKGMIFELSK